MPDGWLSTRQGLLPLVALEELIEVSGRASIEALPELSAMQVAGEPRRGRRGGEIIWHGREQRRVKLAERKLRVQRTRLRWRGGRVGRRGESPNRLGIAALILMTGERAAPRASLSHRPGEVPGAQSRGRTLNITIETRDPDLASRLFPSGSREQLGDGILISRLPPRWSVAPFSPQVIELAVSIAGGVGIGVFSNWLWSKISGANVESVTIERTTVEVVDKETILRIVTEKFHSGR